MKIGAEFWAGHVAAAKLEAISASEYAKQHSISVAALYYWQRKLKPKATFSDSVPFKKFVALRVSDTDSAHHTCLCTLALTSGMRLEMSSLPDPEWLAALGRALPGAH
jgi:hypothetical protein